MLKGSVAMITGACGDIGTAVVQLLARQGAKIVASDVLELAAGEMLLATLREIRAEGIYVKADVTDHAAVKAMVKQAVERFGRLDIAAINHGVVALKPFLEIADRDWAYHLNVNLTGAFYVGQEVAQCMMEKKTSGKIVFTGSWVQDVPSPGNAAYCVSKSGLKMLAKCMAKELAAYKINVNVVAPGNVDAGLSAKVFREQPELREKFRHMIPLGELQTPESVAEAVLFLCSRGADYITGTTLLSDGGASLFRWD